MSLKFEATNDSFLQADLAIPIGARTPMTMIGWVKFVSLPPDYARIMSCGNAVDAYHTIQHNKYNDFRMRTFSNSIGGNSDLNVTSGTQYIKTDTWYAVAMVKADNSSMVGYLAEYNDVVTTLSNLNAAGSWAVNSIPSVSFSNSDLWLAGGAGFNSKDMIIDNWGLLPRAITIQEFEDFKNGLINPGDLPGIKNFWMRNDATDLSELLVDGTGGDTLLVYDIATATENAGLIPPIWVAETSPAPIPSGDPILSALTFNDFTDGTLTATATTDTTTGVIHGVLLDAALPEPSRADIKAGTNGVGTTNPVIVDATSEAITTTGIPVGVDPVDYTLWVYQELTGGGTSNIRSLDYTVSGSTTTIVLDLITVEDGTPYPDATNIRYTVFDGADETDLVAVYSGTTVTYGGGKVSISTPAHVAGNRLMVACFDTDVSDIFADSTKTNIAPMVVV